jgi:hypothetical protein
MIKPVDALIKMCAGSHTAAKMVKHRANVGKIRRLGSVLTQIGMYCDMLGRSAPCGDHLPSVCFG